jgi:hypothetical protein
MSSLGWVCFGVWVLINCWIAQRLLRRPGKSGESECNAVSSASIDDVLSRGKATDGLAIDPSWDWPLQQDEARIDLPRFTRG